MKNENKPTQQFPEAGIMGIQVVEKFARNGRSYVILVVNDVDGFSGEIYELTHVHKGKKDETVEEVMTGSKFWTEVKK